jgi:protease II
VVLSEAPVHRLLAHADTGLRYRAPRTMQGTVLAPTTELVYAEADEAFYLSLKKTKDGRFISVCANSKTTAEIRLLDADIPAKLCTPTVLHLVQQRVPGLEYYLDHTNGHLLILHNGGPSGPDNFDLATATVTNRAFGHAAAGAQRHWRCVVAGTDDRLIDDMDVFDDYCVLYTRHKGAPQIGVISGLRTNKGAFCDANGAVQVQYCREFPTSSEALLLQPGVNAAFLAHELHFSLQSPLDPPRHFRLDLRTLAITANTTDCEGAQPGIIVGTGAGTGTLGGVTGVSGQRLQRFACRVVHAPSHDGAAVPMTLVHRLDLSLDGANPVLLRGYGAYGDWLRPDYEADIFPLLDQGWVVATAHVRGGGFLGRRWYRDGRQLKKWNSFHDFLACADFLVQHGYTRPGRLAAEGASAGGLLVATAANIRPDLFAAVSLRAPFVDVVGAMTDATRPLTVHEYDEWGNPTDGPGSQEVLAYMQSYCPMYNLKRQLDRVVAGDTPHGIANIREPPATLITIAVDDPRVAFADVAQYAVLLREASELAAGLTGQTRPILLHTHGVRGHSGGGRYAVPTSRRAWDACESSRPCTLGLMAECCCVAAHRYEHFAERAFVYSFLQRAMGLPSGH